MIPPAAPAPALLHPMAVLADIAEAEVGAHEIPPGSNRGPRVAAYQAVCGLASTQPTGWPWCAAFVCWTIGQAILRHPGLLAQAIEQAPPREASVYGLEDWAARLGLPASDQGDDSHGFSPQRGDLVFYRFSHVEIVRSASSANSYFQSVGGNTGDAVAVRTRSYALARRFVRLVPRALPVAASLIITR